MSNTIPPNTKKKAVTHELHRTNNIEEDTKQKGRGKKELPFFVTADYNQWKQLANGNGNL